MKITFDEAKEFLRNITGKDTVTIIFHNDIDGFVAGILLADLCEKNGAKINPLPFSTVMNQNEIIKDIGNSNKILIADLAPRLIPKILEAVKDKLTFYTDHHIKDEKVPEKINEYRTPTEISSSNAIYQIIGGRSWLGILSQFADAGWTYKENRKVIDKFLEENNLEVEEFRQRFKFKFDRTICYFNEDLKKSFEILKNLNSLEEIEEKLEVYSAIIKKEIDRAVKEFPKKSEKIGNANYFYFDSEYPIKSEIINEISFTNPESIYIFATPRGPNIISLSARDQTKKNNMAEILKAGIKGLEKANAGGHIPAAGAIIQTKDLEKFKENLKNYITNQKTHKPPYKPF